MLQTILELKLWNAAPLVAAISLVYAATRHEDMRPILIHAARMAGLIVGFNAAIMVVLFAISWWL